MQQARQELHAIFLSRVPDRFARARSCLACARIARQDGDSAAIVMWLRNVQVLRTAAARWRRRAEKLAPVLICLVWCITSGCAKEPAYEPPRRQFAFNFEVRPLPHSQGMEWVLQFKTRDDYHAFLENTPDGADRAEVRKLIAAGLQRHHIVGCSTQEKAVEKLGNDGIAFVGSCGSNHPAHTTLVGGV